MRAIELVLWQVQQVLQLLRLVRRAPVQPEDRGSDDLAMSIEVKKSKYKNGGYIVVAHGPRNYDRYYASFVELGTKDNEAKPFMRPAVTRNDRKVQKMFADRLKKL